VGKKKGSGGKRTQIRPGLFGKKKSGKGGGEVLKPEETSLGGKSISQVAIKRREYLREENPRKGKNDT